MQPVQQSRMATLPNEATEAEAASSMSWRGRGQGGGGEVGGIGVGPGLRRWTTWQGRKVPVECGGRGGLVRQVNTRGM